MLTITKSFCGNMTKILKVGCQNPMDPSLSLVCVSIQKKESYTALSQAQTTTIPAIFSPNFLYSPLAEISYLAQIFSLFVYSPTSFLFPLTYMTFCPVHTWQTRSFYSSSSSYPSPGSMSLQQLLQRLH